MALAPKLGAPGSPGKGAWGHDTPSMALPPGGPKSSEGALRQEDPSRGGQGGGGVTGLRSAKPTAGSAWGGQAGLRQRPQRTHLLEGSRPPRPWEGAGQQPWLKGQRQAERRDPGAQASRSGEVRRGEARPDIAKETPGVPLTVRAPPPGCWEPAGPVPGARGLTCTIAPPGGRYTHGAPTLPHEELPRAPLSPSSPEPAPRTGALGGWKQGAWRWTSAIPSDTGCEAWVTGTAHASRAALQAWIPGGRCVCVWGG